MACAAKFQQRRRTARECGRGIAERRRPHEILVRLPRRRDVPIVAKSPMKYGKTATFRRRGARHLDRQLAGAEARTGTVRAVIRPARMAVRFPKKHHRGERVAASPPDAIRESVCAALQRRRARRRADVSQRSPRSPGASASARLRPIGGWRCACAWSPASAGCILTQDLPDPALDIPARLQGRAADRSGRAADAGLVARLSLAAN